MDNHTDEEAVPETAHDDFVRLPGLFRRWEFEQVVQAGSDFHIEDAGNTADGTPLFALYWRERSNAQPTKEQ